MCEDAMSDRNRPRRLYAFCCQDSVLAVFDGCLEGNAVGLGAEGGEAPQTLQLPSELSESLNELPHAPEGATTEVPVETVVQPDCRSIALIAEHAGISSPVTEHAWVMDRIELSTPPLPPPIPQALNPPPDIEYATFESYSDADACSLGWSEPLIYSVLPQHLLWQPPLANQREPHMFGKFTNF